MADTLKEIFNGDVLFSTFVNGRRVLGATDAATQLVIKDVAVANVTYPVPPNIEINATAVAAAVNSTGSEIVGSNSTIELVTAEILAPFVMASATTSVIFTGGLASGEGNINNMSTDPSSPGVSTPHTPALTGTIRWAGMLNGNFYYIEGDGNSTSSLRRRVGSNNGAENIVSGTTYAPVAFDGVSKFYWYEPSTGLRVHDSATNISTTLTTSVGTATSYPSITVVNGLVFYKPSSATVVLYIYNIATNTQTVVSSPNASNYSNISAFSDGKGNYRLNYTLDQAPITSMFYHEFTYLNGIATPGAFAGPITFRSSGINAMSHVSAGGQYNLGLVNDVIATSKMAVVDKNFTVIKTKLIPGLPASVTTQGLISLITRPASSLTAAERDTLGPRLRLRITGIEST